MKNSAQQFVYQLLQNSLYVGLAFLVLTAPWNTGWHLVGDAYALGPYLPWLELVFPLAGLGLWIVFFSAWTLGELRSIHITRWFYLLLFVALLMVNVIFSVNPVGSLGWLTLWLTGSLVLSLQLHRVFNHRFFWLWYLGALALNFVLWQVYPALIKPELLLFTAWLPALHAWQQTENARGRYGLMVLTLLAAWYLPVSVGMQLLVWGSWACLWASEYRLYRRKSLGFWITALITLGLYLGICMLPQWSFAVPQFLQPQALGGQFSWWHGVGWGQLEWAQYQAQSTFNNPGQIASKIWLGSRWWYETGLLLVLWLPSLWLLTVGHAQSLKFRTLLFWSIALLAPVLWLSPGGIILGCFWFFNRESWEKKSD